MQGISWNFRGFPSLNPFKVVPPPKKGQFFCFSDFKIIYSTPKDLSNAKKTRSRYLASFENGDPLKLDNNKCLHYAFILKSRFFQNFVFTQISFLTIDISKTVLPMTMKF